jgi:hypothetical protein
MRERKTILVSGRGEAEQEKFFPGRVEAEIKKVSPFRAMIQTRSLY